MRSIRHRLEAAGDDDLVLAEPDELVGVRDRAQPRQAQLVQRDRWHVEADATGDRGLSRRVRADTGLHHVAHDHRIDVARGNARSAQGLTDGNPAEVGCAHTRQAAEKAADRRAGAGDDD